MLLFHVKQQHSTLPGGTEIANTSFHSIAL
jgi:hypothetical protein